MFSLSLLGVLCLALIAITILATKGPLILSFQPTGEELSEKELPRPEDEVRAATKKYLEKRYKWEPKNVKERLLETEAFVLPGSRQVFRGAVANVIKFSTERLVSQRVYAEKIDVNLEKKTVQIFGDRVTSIQGLKAAGNLKLELSFESGPRTKENPWGVYITKEKEEQ